MSSWTYMEIDGVPVIAKTGGLNDTESEDPVEDIAEAKLIWLSGWQATQLDLRDGEEVEVYLPDTGYTYDGMVRDFTGDAKQIEITSNPTLDLTMDEAEKAAFPGPGTIRSWHQSPVNEGERKSTWRRYENEVPPETLFRMPLAEGV